MALFFQKAEHDLAGNVADLQQELQRTRGELQRERKAHANTTTELEDAAAEIRERGDTIKRMDRKLKGLSNPHADGERHFKVGCVTCLLGGYSPKTEGHYAICEAK